MPDRTSLRRPHARLRPLESRPGATLRTLLAAAFLLCIAPATRAQQQACSPPAPGGVQITFLPPPLEGTLSAGVYTVDGKLLRTLAREATERDFTVGLNGFITRWDGKDDAGKPVSAGKYFVRGYAVAAIDVEGVAFHGNDWLSGDDTVPRIIDILALQLDGSELLLAAKGLGPKDCIIHLSRESGEMKFDVFDREALSTGAADAPFSSPAAESLALKLSAPEKGPQVSSPGKAGSIWTIVIAASDSPTRRKIVQTSADGSEIFRELEFQLNEPQPSAIAASLERDEIYLLERNDKETRVRGLRLKRIENAADGKAVSDWELFLTKSIHRFPAFEAFASHLNRTSPPQPVEKLRVRLVANELLSVAPAAVQISARTDESGSFLRTMDGLLLRRVTDTPHLRWATLTTDRDGTISLFESDGAAVEEYRLGKLNQMMAFDAGEYEVAAPK